MKTRDWKLQRWASPTRGGLCGIHGLKDKRGRAASELNDIAEDDAKLIAAAPAMRDMIELLVHAYDSAIGVTLPKTALVEMRQLLARTQEEKKP